jgi:cytochrome P450
MLAARDTTAVLLSFTVYLLAMHPDVMKKLREEILEQVGIDAAPTVENIRELKYRMCSPLLTAS